MSRPATGLADISGLPGLPGIPRDSADGAPPLALYVHFPWCVKKCPYCDFNSHALRDEGDGSVIDQRGYIDALIRDLEFDLGRYPCARSLSSIFLGGGTPSLFGGAAIGALLGEIRARLAFADDIEITLEANPGAVEHDDFAAYRAAGVNRLSLGAQSFDDAQLKTLGRAHTADEARRAIQAALDAGFANLNLDLMYGLPGQTPASARRDLESALAFAPAHLSLFRLTIEPNTRFHRHPPALPGDGRIMAIQRGLHGLAGRHGYRRYEVSAYAKPGRRCRHNLNYWQFGDYLGIGAGAHGKITHGGEISRYWKHKHPKRYLESAGDQRGRGIGATRSVAGDEALFEFLLNSLRLTDGFDAALIPQRTGRETGEATALLAGAIRRRLVVLDGGRIRCSRKGYWFLDEILQQALPPAPTPPH